MIRPAIVLVALLCACSDSARDRPNVLLISVDTLRADHVGCLGYPRATTPTIDQFAAEGVLFTQHVSSSSWTLPAHAALFTSLPDSLHGATDVDRKLSDTAVTLAERFRDAHYRTSGFFAGPFLHPCFGLAQGFESYEDCTSYAALMDGRPASEWARDEQLMTRSHRDVTNNTVVAAFEHWFAGRGGDRPFFAFVHLWDVHFDFTPPPPYNKQFDPDYKGSVTGENFFFDPSIHARMPARDLEHLVALYDGEIAWTDAAIGRIRALLEKAGVLENTIVVITSDHGTEFFEHGDKAHRKTLYDEVLRIPLVVRYPKSLPQGVRVTSQTCSLDVGPTLLELCGLPSTPATLGESLVALAHDPKARHSPYAVSELFSVGRNQRTVRTSSWKMFKDLAQDRVKYYDLGSDAREQRPLHDFATGLGPEARAGFDSTCSGLEAFARAHRTPAADDARAATTPGIRRQTDTLGYTGSDETPPK